MRSSMNDPDALQESILQYEIQLAQVQASLNGASAGDRAELEKLCGDIQELILLTKESLKAAQQKDECLRNGSTLGNSATDSIDDEYALFQAEIATLDDTKSEDTQENGCSSTNVGAVQSELEALEGMKCQAPHSQEWGQLGYHNAIVLGVEPVEEKTSFEDIKVRVVFCNPTQKNMLPCPYFMDGHCRYEENECHYSHGEVVSLSELREYKTPAFSNVKLGSRVLAKYTDGLWYPAVVDSQDKAGKYVVRYQSYGNTRALDLSDILPSTEEDNSEDEDDEDSDTPLDEAEEQEDEALKEVWLLRAPTKALGQWEKHTRGIGSKLMEKMGYVLGTGLGRNGEGRIEPVEAVVMPAGKSLDHCMALKEKAGGEDIFKVEKRMKRKQRKLELQQKRRYERVKKRHTLFDFINSRLGDKKGASSSGDAPLVMRKSRALPKTNLKEATTKKLNLQHFQVEENIKQAEKELFKLKASLTRHSRSELTATQIRSKISDKQKEIALLQESEKRIRAEQSSRKNQQKLTIF